ncbi:MULTISPECIES: hypothetical protein [unclassified Cupriavidus]|uniref:hypothetical protein n=1 Tax=unclassified Cupriavidus TaxID=2640874 RepID=UPI0010F53C26|nr:MULTISPECIES: hypothetical protein [unclassified Cupriavidus]MWL86605.1 hypothetical protein [Cupriavidus sp. SW-Y-13]
MQQEEWRVEGYRGMDAYVLVTSHRDAVAGSVGDTQTWGYEVRVGQEGADPADAGDTEILSSGAHVFATRHAAEVAAFAAAYAWIDKLLGDAR